SVVSHQFLASGVFPVTLTAIDSAKARVNSSVTITVSQPGDACVTPLDIAVGTFPRSMTADSEAVTTNNLTDPIPTCWPYRPNRRVWYTFTPAVTGSYEFSTCGTFDTVIGVYSGACGALT